MIPSACFLFGDNLFKFLLKFFECINILELLGF